MNGKKVLFFQIVVITIFSVYDLTPAFSLRKCLGGLHHSPKAVEVMSILLMHGILPATRDGFEPTFFEF